MTSDHTSQNGNFYSQESNFWENYVRGRPHAPDSFFSQIFAYHEKHSGEFSVVHDAGAGAGVHSRRLAERFDTVLVTDPSESNLSAARGLLLDSESDSKSKAKAEYIFHKVKLEESGVIPDRSVDMVFGASMMHWTELDDALAQVVRQLKPRGTFIASLFALPRFPSDLDVQDAWDAIIQKIVRARKPETISLQTWYEFATLQATGYDYLALDPEVWTAVERWKVNDRDDPSGGVWRNMFAPPGLEEQIPNDRRIGRDEKVVFCESDEWTFQGDWEFVKTALFTVPMDFESEEFKPLVERLEGTLAGGKVVNGTWPMTLIMATKG